MRGQTGLFLIIFLILVLAATGLVVILNYNGIIKAEKAVGEAKAQIAAVCQRRLDLIPNLVEIVKGYAQHEKDTLIAITKARSSAKEILDEVSGKKSLNKEDITALTTSQSELSHTLKSIFALAENYPDLKASSNFLALQDQLEGSENRVAVARIRYNHEVRIYNSKIATFPGVILAPMFGFEQKDSFEAKEEAQEAVKIKF